LLRRVPSFVQFASGTGSGIPPAPASISVKAAKTSAKISWTASSGATGYAVFVSYIPNGETTYESQFFVTTATKIDVTGLASGQPYGVAVAAVNSGGAAETTTSFTTP
jgi:hypothetical protein